MDRKEYQRLHYLKNKAKKQEQYYKNHEHFLQYKKDYLKTEIGHKSCKIKNWKAFGIKLRDGEDWESIYYYVESLDNCEECDNLFKSSRDRHLDHDHKTGYIRDIVCCSCNQKRKFKDTEGLNFKIVENFKK